MEIKKTIDFGSLKLSFVKNVTYDSLDTESFKETFNTLKSSGYLKAKDFDSKIWHFKDDTGVVDTKVSFELEVYRELNLALKGFILMLRSTGHAPSSIRHVSSHISELIWKTEGLMNVDKFESHLREEANKTSFIQVKAAIIKFSSFYDFPLKDSFLEKLSLYQPPKVENRSLPPFFDVFQFDDVMNNYTNSSISNIDRLKYYPIELWWYITNIIPMRPNELLRLKKNCLSVRNDGTYWIIVTRSKKQSDNAEQEVWEQELQINQNIYKFIREYQLKLEQLNIGTTSQFLIPQDLYKYTHKLSENDYERYSPQQFGELLRDFYINIVEGMYNTVNIQKIKPGDTRHFAIINMFLQGFNMLFIARMAGHSTLSEPANYYGHIEELTKCYTYHLFSTRTIEHNIESKFNGGFFGYRRKAYDRGLKYEDKDTSKYRPVRYGFCMDISNTFPSNCADDCRECNFYIFKPTIDQYEEGLGWLEDYSIHIDKKMEEQIDVLKILNSSTSKETNTNNSNEIKRTSKKLQQYMDYKVTLDLKLLKEQYQNE